MSELFILHIPICIRVNGHLISDSKQEEVKTHLAAMKPYTPPSNQCPPHTFMKDNMPSLKSQERTPLLPHIPLLSPKYPPPPSQHSHHPFPSPTNPNRTLQPAEIHQHTHTHAFKAEHCLQIMTSSAQSRLPPRLRRRMEKSPLPLRDRDLQN